jgi:1-deoxy-D-xylulose-5-phosphate reductoisomerase
VKRIAILGSTGSIGQSTLSICEVSPTATRLSRSPPAATSIPLRPVPPLAPACGLAGHRRIGRRTRAAPVSARPASPAPKSSTAPKAPSASPPCPKSTSWSRPSSVSPDSRPPTPPSWPARPSASPTRKPWSPPAKSSPRRPRERNVALLPIDSEHNAVHQCMRVGKRSEVKQIWLTASGGPFRHPHRPVRQHHPRAGAQASHLGHGPPHHHRLRHHAQQGLRDHRSLPPLRPAALQVKVTVHPQSTVHSLVEYVDGSILARRSPSPTCACPSSTPSAYPERVPSDMRFRHGALSDLHFEPPDLSASPACASPMKPPRREEPTAIALNAADEIAVEAFLERVIPFTGIPATIEQVLETTPETHPATIKEVLALDTQARELAREALAGREASHRR